MTVLFFVQTAENDLRLRSASGKMDGWVYKASGFDTGETGVFLPAVLMPKQ